MRTGFSDIVIDHHIYYLESFDLRKSTSVAIKDRSHSHHPGNKTSRDFDLGEK